MIDNAENDGTVLANWLEGVAAFVKIKGKMAGDDEKFRDKLQRCAAALEATAKLEAENTRLRKALTEQSNHEEALLNDMRSLPDIPSMGTMRALEYLAMNLHKPDLWKIGKTLQRRHGLKAVPPKTERECAVGLWHLLSLGLRAALTPPKDTP